MQVLTSTNDSVAILKGDVVSVLTNVGSPVRHWKILQTRVLMHFALAQECEYPGVYAIPIKYTSHQVRTACAQLARIDV